MKTIYSAVEKGYIPHVTKERLAWNRKVVMFSDGHIIIPKKIRRLLDFNDGDLFDLEINEEAREIIFRKDE